MRTTLPFDVSRCIGRMQIQTCDDGYFYGGEPDAECVDCLRRTAPVCPDPNRQRWVEPPDQLQYQNDCPLKIEP